MVSQFEFLLLDHWGTLIANQPNVFGWIAGAYSDEQIEQDHEDSHLCDKPANGAHAWNCKGIGGDISEPTDDERPPTGH